jgi:hypothetical protein
MTRCPLPFPHYASETARAYLRRVAVRRAARQRVRLLCAAVVAVVVVVALAVAL